MSRVGDRSRVYLAGICPDMGAAGRARLKVVIVRRPEWPDRSGILGCFFVNFLWVISRPNRLISKAFSKISLDLRAATH